MISILHDLLNTTINCSLGYQAFRGTFYQPNPDNQQRSHTNKIHNIQDHYFLFRDLYLYIQYVSYSKFIIYFVLEEYEYFL